MNFIDHMAQKLSVPIFHGAADVMSDTEFLAAEISKWKCSPERIMQIKGYLYYANEHDILFRRRTVIGEDGMPQTVENLPNNRIIDNQYAKLVNQKANYLLGQPIVFTSENERYAELVKKVLGKRFMRTLKSAGKAMLNGGIAWLYPYYNDEGELAFRLFPAYEILPFWKDSEHTILDCAVRLYETTVYEGRTPVIIERVEVYDLSGIHRYIFRGGSLEADTDFGEQTEFYVKTADGSGLNWSRIPLIPLKYNESGIPLIKRVKSLQDGINIMMSDFENSMQEDARNTILVLTNYDGTNLGEFRKNLATYGAVKVRSDGDSRGGVETLKIEVNCENYRSIIEIFKKALIENGMGFDAKNERLSGNPNQMNIQSMYSDIDLDANDMETELQAAFEEIFRFVNAYLANSGLGDFSGEKVNVIFNRDILINESEAIENCAKSAGILSDETIVEQHPWVDDKEAELRRIAEQKERERAELEKQQGYGGFPHENGGVSNEEKAGGLLAGTV